MAFAPVVQTSMIRMLVFATAGLQPGLARLQRTGVVVGFPTLIARQRSGR